MKLPKLSNTSVSFLSGVLAVNANVSTNMLYKNMLYLFLSNLCLFINIHICEYMNFFYVSIYRQYTTEKGHRSFRMLWSLYYSFIGLKCHNYALCLRSVDK